MTASMLTLRDYQQDCVDTTLAAFRKLGEATKGNPRRFSSLKRRLEIVPDDSGNDDGNYHDDD